MPLHEIGSFGVQDTTVSITTKGFVSCVAVLPH